MLLRPATSAASAPQPASRPSEASCQLPIASIAALMHLTASFCPEPPTRSILPPTLQLRDAANQEISRTSRSCFARPRAVLPSGQLLPLGVGLPIPSSSLAGAPSLFSLPGAHPSAVPGEMWKPLNLERLCRISPPQLPSSAPAARASPSLKQSLPGEAYRAPSLPARVSPALQSLSACSPALQEERQPLPLAPAPDAAAHFGFEPPFGDGLHPLGAAAGAPTPPQDPAEPACSSHCAP
mmetsp:Transcript_102463/g.182003  ORF Transcript_102463/g.182003 Transcript_102463/m.182003 type:complete len:239 (-) Transcript_102463:1101-1817(-)